MSDQKIIEAMIAEVEAIVRDKVKEDFSVTTNKQKKTVAKTIISKLEEVIEDEDKSN